MTDWDPQKPGTSFGAPPLLPWDHFETPPVVPPARPSNRHKLLIGLLAAALGIGASIMSCVGQTFGYRQARALEGIEQQLREMRASCPGEKL